MITKIVLATILLGGLGFAQLAPTQGWDGPGLGHVELCYAFGDFVHPDIPDLEANKFIARKALAEWAKYVQIDFRECGDQWSLKTIYISFQSWLYSGARAAACYPPDIHSEPCAGNVSLNPNIGWGPQHVGGDLYQVLLHELGHSLGLAHREDVASIMYPYGHSWMQTFTQADVDAIRLLYAYREPPLPPDGGRCERDGTCGTTQPPALSITASAPASVPGYFVTVTGTITGGTAPYTISWHTATHQGFTAWSNPYYAQAYVVYGINTITVKVVDAQQREATATVQVLAGVGG